MLSVCLSVCLFVCLFVCLPVRLSVCLSVGLPVSLSVCLSVCRWGAYSTFFTGEFYTSFTAFVVVMAHRNPWQHSSDRGCALVRLALPNCSATHRYSISQEVKRPDRGVRWCGDVFIEKLKTHHDQQANRIHVSLSLSRMDGCSVRTHWPRMALCVHVDGLVCWSWAVGVHVCSMAGGVHLCR